MKKKWQTIVGLVMALAVMATAAVPALAQEDKPAATDALSVRGSLAIIAPWAVKVNSEFTARVFLRENQEPFPGAGVWAISADAAETLKEELGVLREGANQVDTEKGYESVLNGHGIFLGRTGEDGRVSHAFERGGGYILVAARNGLRPGFTHIRVGETVNALGIRAPRRAPVGEEVTIGVFARLTQEPVEGAGVWAVSRDMVETLQQEAQALKEDADTPVEEKDYEALVKDHSKFLGLTDKDGRLTHTFREAGGYLLVAVKKGYFPGFAPLAVVTKPKALSIKATPPQSHVGKEVTLHVSDRESNDPVEGAGVWAFSRDEVANLREEMASLRGNSGNATGEMDYEAVIASRGAYLGRTDEKGRLSVTFTTAGGYVLVTAKRGYLPGFTTLAVRDLPKPKPERPESAAANRPANRPVQAESRPVPNQNANTN